MQNIHRIATMRSMLTQALQPTLLEIIDESHLHRGHAGAASGAGHFKLRISAEALNDLSPVQSHRLIYQALDEMMGPDIHALSIEVVRA